MGVESDENCDRMRHLGLGKFIVDGNPEYKKVFRSKKFRELPQGKKIS